MTGGSPASDRPGATPPGAADGRPVPVGLLGRLVGLISGSYDVDEILTVTTLLAHEYRTRGFEVSRVPVAGRGDLLIAEVETGRPGRRVGRRITIVGHSDTVWPAGSLPDARLRVDEAADRWVGPGVGDMKAALLLAAVAAERAAAAVADAPAGLIRIVVVPDEEVGSVGSTAHLVALALESDLCIGLEAGKPDGEFVTSRGAVGAVRIEAAGVAAHVTETGGVNAVDGLLDALARVRAIDVPGVQISLTQLDGGTARQIAAAHASAWIDVRADDSAAMTAAVDGIRDAVTAADSAGPAAVTMTGGQTRPALPERASAEPFAIVTELSAQSGWAAPRRFHERGGSDASTFADVGVPTIDGFGPACFDNCAPGESVSIRSVDERIAVMSGLITRWMTREEAR